MIVFGDCSWIVISSSAVFISFCVTCLAKACVDRVLVKHLKTGQLEHQDPSEINESVPNDVIPKQNQSTCPSYNELFELDKGKHLFSFSHLFISSKF